MLLDKTTIHVNIPENMFPNDCLQFDQLRRDIKSQSKLVQLVKEAKQLFDQIEVESDKRYWKSRSISGICNNLRSMEKHQFNLPPGITFRELDHFCHLSGKEYSLIYDSKEPKIMRLGIGRFLGDLLSIISPSEVNSHPSLSIFVGHDNTLGPIMNGLKLVQNEHPPMASYLMLEIWRDNLTDTKYFQILYHDSRSVRRLLLPSCHGEDLCELEFLEKSFRGIIPIQYEIECGV